MQQHGGDHLTPSLPAKDKHNNNDNNNVVALPAGEHGKERSVPRTGMEAEGKEEAAGGGYGEANAHAARIEVRFRWIALVIASLSGKFEYF